MRLRTLQISTAFPDSIPIISHLWLNLVILNRCYQTIRADVEGAVWPMYGRSANGPWQEGERLGNGGCISLTRNVVSMCACATVRVQGLLSYVWTSLHDSYAKE